MLNIQRKPEVIHRVNDSITQGKGAFLPLPPLLKRRLKDNEFEIVPQMAGRRNSFTSKIKGVINFEGIGSRIRVRMTLVTIVLLLLSAAFIVIRVSTIKHIMKSNVNNEIEILKYGPLAAELWLYCIAVYAFKKDGSYSKTKLLEILDGRIEIK